MRATVAVDGLTFAYHRTGGDKPPLVLCHGITDNGLCWTRVARELEDTFDVIMLDARGHGESDKAAPTATSHVEDLAGVIDALGIEQSALMGHSMGARTVAGYAANHPERASRIVLEDPPWRAPDARRVAQRADLFGSLIAAFKKLTPEEGLARGRKLNPGWHADEFPAWVESNRQTAENVVEAMVHEPWQDIVPRLKCPTLLIVGETDRGGIVSEALLEEIQATNPLVQTARLAGAGHNIRRERFEAFVGLVRAFLT